MKQKWIIISVISIVFIAFLISVDSAISKSESKTERGFLGVVVEPLSKKMKSDLGTDYGVLIAEVELDSPADEYGLTEDDVILKVNDIKIRRPNTLTRAIRKIKPGEKAKILILRDGKKKTLEVKIGQLKEAKNFDFSFKPQKMAIKIATKARLGVHLADLNEDLASYFNVKKGALVIDVEEDSPAEKANVKAGDVIVRVNDEKVDDADDVREIIGEAEPDEEVTVEVVRHGKNEKLTAKLEETENEENFLIMPGEGKHGVMMFSPNKLMDMNEKMLRWYRPDKNIRIEKKKIIKNFDNVI
ncbi:MAG: PDZ domain-containing protein [Calditrichaeota bacterium]|nr:PDZ domain-containing protein [Calditrichota bacterium]